MTSTQETPRQFGKYWIERKLGQGGMGAVYLAYDSALQRWVALKVPQFDPAEGKTVVARFQREARVAASIDHPNLCPVYEVGEIDGAHYFTMPFIEGWTLASLLEQGPMPPRQAAELIRKLALALAELHRRGVIHRDLKPANIMIRKNGEPVLMDFGLARSFASNSTRLTAAGGSLGTPAYMSPEQVSGEQNLGPATDVWSLGVLLYECLTGRQPFEGPPAAMIYQLLHTQPTPPSSVRPGIDPELDAICLRALSKEAASRYPDMGSLARALEAYLAGALSLAAVTTAPATTLPPRLPTVVDARAPTVQQPRQPATNRNLLGVVVALGLCVIGLGVGLLLALKGKHKEDAQAGTSTPTSQQPTQPVVTGRLKLLLPTAVEVVPGQSVSVDLELERTACPGAVSLSLQAPSPDITLTVAPVPDGVLRGTLQLTAGPSASPGARLLKVQAQAGNIRDVQEIKLVIRTLESRLAILPIAPLRLDAGSMGEIAIRLQRTAFTGRVTVELTGNRQGLTCPSATIDNNEGRLRVTCSPFSAPGLRNLTVTARGGGLSDSTSVRLTVAPPRAGSRATTSGGMKLAYIPAGRFQMGATADDSTAPATAKPQHTVDLSRGFWMGACEVTVGQFREFVRDTGYQTEAEKDGRAGWGIDPSTGNFGTRQTAYTWKNTAWPQTDDHPVTNITWNDAVAFCAWLSKKEGVTCDLPTEAEWEYAARAGTTSKYHFGDAPEDLARYGNVSDAAMKARFPGILSSIKANDGYALAAPVGKFLPNAWGLYDMHGNVWEWCKDGERTYSAQALTDPVGPLNDRRMIRGGCWGSDPSYARIYHRGAWERNHRGDLYGFRVIFRPGS